MTRAMTRISAASTRACAAAAGTPAAATRARGSDTARCNFQ